MSSGGANQAEWIPFLRALAIIHVLRFRIGLCMMQVSSLGATFLVALFDQQQPAINLSAFSFPSFESCGLPYLCEALSKKRTAISKLHSSRTESSIFAENSPKSKRSPAKKSAINSISPARNYVKPARAKKRAALSPCALFG